MSRQLLDAALALSESERAVLAAELIDSLDPVIDADHEAAWNQEIVRRISAVERGEAKTVPWDEVLRRMTDRK